MLFDGPRFSVDGFVPTITNGRARRRVPALHYGGASSAAIRKEKRGRTILKCLNALRLPHRTACYGGLRP
jgi:hypothetical protein